MLWEFCILLFTLSFLVFTLFSILYLWQLRKTAKHVEMVLSTLNQSLPAIMAKMESLAGDLSEAASTIRTQVYGLAGAVQKVNEMVDEVVLFERSVRRDIETPILEVLGTYRAIVKGVQAFVSTFLSR